MAEIIENDSGKKGGKKNKLKKTSTHVDMTPMVDLACLLLTFFMLTTAFSKAKVMEITMPEKDKKEDKKEDETKVRADLTLNVILGADDKIFWYAGAIEKDKPLPELHVTNYGKDGIRKILLKRNENVFKQIFELREKIKKGELILSNDTIDSRIKAIKKGDKHAPIILIKAEDKAKYRNLVDIIDEMAITNISKYAVVEITPEEKELILNSK
ncbi:MAG: hypothetical protein A2X12_08665 [Bacteroidetes bacterium GWE2_29_8]|nr:MAG: hypothetical protein A2X12_08665 [Bacteroidetes bacterium GWE2_29_8]